MGGRRAVEGTASIALHHVACGTRGAEIGGVAHHAITESAKEAQWAGCGCVHHCVEDIVSFADSTDVVKVTLSTVIDIAWFALPSSTRFLQSVGADGADTVSRA